MKKATYTPQYTPNDAPQSLKDLPFYGLTLDQEQEIFRDCIYDPKKLIVLCNAKAGSGKTLVSLGVADILVQYGFYKGIVYIASPTQEQRQGYLPGDQESKSAPYMQPLIDAMLTLGINPMQALITSDNIQGVKEGKAYIEFTVDTYMRGINLENKVIIIDEAANFYYDSLKKVLTRIHDNCKTIVIGHTGQCDLYKHQERSGFRIYLDAFKSIQDERVAICELHTNHRGWVSNFCDNVNIDGTVNNF